MNKELRTKTNEELCVLIMKLKLRLLESRFRMASGELEKTHQLVEIRKTISRALTILKQRDLEVSIGTHGVTIYNLKTKEVKSINNVVEQALASEAIDEKSAKHISEQEAIKEATVEQGSKPTTTEPEQKQPVQVIKKELKTNMERAKAHGPVIRKSIGGGS